MIGSDLVPSLKHWHPQMLEVPDFIIFDRCGYEHILADKTRNE